MTPTTVGNHQPHIRPGACELIRKVALALVLAATLAVPTPAPAAESPALVLAMDGAALAAQPAAEHGAAQAGEEHAAEEHGVFAGLLWPTVNFIILVGILWYFLKQPMATYLTERHTAIRRELVEAANVKATAAAQLAEIDRKLQALPGVIEALKHRGAEEIAAEEQRIAGVAAAERDRLLEQTRREIDLQVRLAKRELVEHAAELAVQIATDRIKQNITPADQARLVDRYLHQVSTPPEPPQTPGSH
jgi:F-type H+-transporting ATPase subunit b